MFAELNDSQLIKRVVIGYGRVAAVEHTREEYPCRHCGKIINVDQAERWFNASKELGPLPEEKGAFMFHVECFEKIVEWANGNDKPEVTWFGPA